MGKYTAIDDPSAYFQTTLYTGSGTPTNITNGGNSDLQPDMVWIKLRNSNNGAPHISDSTRGVSTNTGKYIRTDDNGAESDDANGIRAFNTDGFKTGDGWFNGASSSPYVAWQWKANGGTTSSNTDGSITSTVQANQDAGFSIVTWTGNTTGSSQTIGHGLGSAPKTIIVKDRDSTAVWVSYHEPLGTGKYMQLNSTAAQGSISNYWSSTAPSSTVFGVIGDNGGAGYANNVSGNDMIAYCFVEKQGYSKFGSYKGNGNADGPFVYTGFKPAFVLFKKSSDSGDNWMMYDNKRPGFNVTDQALHPNSLAAEYDNANANLDILSNGFKLRSSFGWVNQNTHTYIYMAFAENPFVTSTGIMGTAR